MAAFLGKRGLFSLKIPEFCLFRRACGRMPPLAFLSRPSLSGGLNFATAGAREARNGGGQTGAVGRLTGRIPTTLPFLGGRRSNNRAEGLRYIGAVRAGARWAPLAHPDFGFGLSVTRGQVTGMKRVSGGKRWIGSPGNRLLRGREREANAE
jgi:hypothetical protein